jgi:hypothetical protein
MESEGTKINRLSERHFGSITFLLRLGGIPFRMKKISTIYTIYMTTLIFCGFANFVGMLLDGCVHWDDLGRAITSLRVFVSLLSVIWLYAYCRYVRTLPISVSAKQLFKNGLQFHK